MAPEEIRTPDPQIRSLVRSSTIRCCRTDWKHKLDSSVLCEIAGVDVAGSFHAPIWPKPAITLSRKDWHSSANRAVL